MGYTHYWKRTKTKLTEVNLIDLRGQLEITLDRYKNIIQYDSDIAQSPELYIDWKNMIVCIRFNGINNNAHETFMINHENNNFCKTARKPYDQAVCECLLIYHHYKILSIDSDGFSNYTENKYKVGDKMLDDDIDGKWFDALQYVNKLLQTQYYFKCDEFDKNNVSYNININNNGWYY